MGFVYNDFEFIGIKFFDFFEYVREFLNCSDDDFFFIFQGLFELFIILSDGLYYFFNLGEIVDIIVDLFVQNLLVGNDDYGIKDVVIVIIMQFCKLMGQLGDGV